MPRAVAAAESRVKSESEGSKFASKKVEQIFERDDDKARWSGRRPDVE